MRIRLILTFLMFIALIGCDEESKISSGKVIFYTNAQLALDCGPFDVDIYIDNSLVGTLEEPFLPSSDTPDCNVSSSKSILTIKKPEGGYEFTAKLTCSETLKYLGDFSVKKDSCSFVYIDLTYSD